MIASPPGWHREVWRARLRRWWPTVAQVLIAVVLSVLLVKFGGI